MSLTKHTAEITSAFVINNEIAAEDVPGLILSIHQALTEIGGETKAEIPEFLAAAREPTAAATQKPTAVAAEEPETTEIPKPFLPIDQAVTQDVVTCLFCGKEGKTLRGHIRSAHDMDVNTYRAQFSLPNDFPMVAPSYSEKRRNLAKEAGLGQRSRKGRQNKNTT